MNDLPPPAPAVSPPPPIFAPTPFVWRAALGGGVLLLGLVAYAAREPIGPRGQAGAGVVCILGFVAMLSANLRAVNWRTIALGILLQLGLALFILRFEIRGLGWLGIPEGFAPGYELFYHTAEAVGRFLDFTNAGSRFVFGPLADRGGLGRVFGAQNDFIFAVGALPPIIFVSSFFTVLYYLGILQWVVRILARVMVYLMQTSGAESLSAAANVFMGQTEAPLIVQPYVRRMTQSELLALMVGGMATISGGLMAVYINMGADRVAILATSAMAAPCGLYLSKLMLPELEQPETRGLVTGSPPPPQRNVIDAAAAGASAGLSLALNVAAMLIAFLAFLALINYLLSQIPRDPGGLLGWLREAPGWPAAGNLFLLAIGYSLAYLAARAGWRGAARPSETGGGWPIPLRIGGHLLGLAAFLLLVHLAIVAGTHTERGLSLRVIFSTVFAPVAFLMGVQGDDVFGVASLLGTKLTVNEFVAYIDLTQNYRNVLSERSYTLATYALTGFANFASIGIQLGGIGAMAEERRPDLARLGGRALLVGFLATVLNAAVAGILMPGD